MECGRRLQRAMGDFLGNGNFLDWNGSYMGVYICQMSPKCIGMCEFYYMLIMI